MNDSNKKEKSLFSREKNYTINATLLTVPYFNRKPKKLLADLKLK